jgi:tetratricopeptide (TPR) repeat protein
MRRARSDTAWPLVLFCLAAFGAESHAISELRQFQKAPVFSLTDLDGKVVASETIRGHPAVLVFGELSNRNTLGALKDLAKIRSTGDLAGFDVPVYLIVSQASTPAELKKDRRDRGITAVILRDTTRAAYAAFNVVVLPSVVVLDKDGLVCAAVSGYPLTFSDVMQDALLYAVGKLTRPAFEKMQQPSAQPSPEEEAILRSQRIASFAGQLLARGYPELAMERYKEALKLNEKSAPARVGLARCLVKLNRLDEAGKELDEALAADPAGPETNLAVAQLEIARGGDDLFRAQDRLLRVTLVRPSDANAHYLLGKAYEAQGHLEKAVTEYRKAAELLLEARGG